MHGKGLGGGGLPLAPEVAAGGVNALPLPPPDWAVGALELGWVGPDR